MPAREKSASTPSLMSSASSSHSEMSANGGNSSSNRNSFHSIKSSFTYTSTSTSSSSSSSSVFSGAGKQSEGSIINSSAPTTIMMLPGDDFEDLKVEDTGAEESDEPDEAHKNIDIEGSGTSDHVSTDSSGSNSSGPSSLTTEG